jgi:hypothetical protein
MNVYVASNFVLELALEQEQCDSCTDLLRLASAGSVHIVIPAFSLAEPHITMMRRGNERAPLSAEVQRHLSELERSKSFRESPGRLGELIGLLITSAERERAGLTRTVEALLEKAEVIPLNTSVFQRAGGIQIPFDMSVQDSILLASIISHLAETKPPQSCFLNRNTRDFDDPSIREMLEDFRCKFFGRFDDGLDYYRGSPA